MSNKVTIKIYSNAILNYGTKMGMKDLMKIFKDKNAKSIKSIAIVDMYLEEYREFMDVDDLTVVKCNNQADCFEELRKKSVDAVLVDGYYAENVIKNDYKNRNLEIENALSGEYNVSEVVAIVNIPDICYFNKLFKRTYNISPG